MKERRRGALVQQTIATGKGRCDRDINDGESRMIGKE